MSDLITTPQELAKACAILAQAPEIGFDTEFIRETTYYPQLALIQLATDTHVFLVDPTAFDKAALAPLQAILTDSQILKIIHSAQADEECLWTTYGYLATPIFDTSIAASLVGLGDQVGLARLLEQTVNVTIEKGHTRTNWLARPLPQELLTYAREDVAHLTAVHRKLAADLRHIGRLEWAKELSAAWTRPERFTANTVDMAAKMGRRKRMDAKALSLLARLMTWREGVAQKLNVPRRRVADDQALMDIAVARPDTAGHLHSFRGIHRGVMANHTNELITLCKDTSVLPELTALRAEKARDSLDERLAIELFQYAVKILAIRHKLSSKHLLDRETAERVVFGKFSSSKEWVAAELMNEEIHRMIGAELWEFLHGNSALTMKNGDCIIVATSKSS